MAIAAIVIVFAIWKAYEGRQTTGTINIGGAFTLTGDAAAYGEAERNGSLLAVDEVNKQGGINGKTLRLVMEDTGSDNEKTVSAVTKLLSIDRVSGVIETWADTYGGANPLYDQYDVVMFSPSASVTALQSGAFYKNAFSTYFRSDVEIEQLADDLASQSKKTVAIMMQNDSYWNDVADRFSAEARKDGLSVVETYKFNVTDSDFRAEWAKIKALRPDAVLFGADGDQETFPFLKQRAEIYPDAHLYTAEFIEEYLPKPQYAGLFGDLTYIRPRQFANQANSFALDYKTKFGGPPPLDASNAYDAVMILAEALRNAGTKSEDVRNYVHSTTFDTVTFGKIGFDKIGGVTETGFELVNPKL